VTYSQKSGQAPEPVSVALSRSACADSELSSALLHPTADSPGMSTTHVESSAEQPSLSSLVTREPPIAVSFWHVPGSVAGSGSPTRTNPHSTPGKAHPQLSKANKTPEDFIYGT
jgi:hypothetical protein